MWKLKLTYSAALQLARESRAQILPNPGFQKQLRIWEFCGYQVFVTNEETGEKNEKPAYHAWKREVDALRGEDKDRLRVSALAGMAAAVGRRRNESQESQGVDQGVDQEIRRHQWDNVEQQERMWNDRLIRGQVVRAAANDTDAQVSSLTAALGIKRPNN